MKAGKIGSMNVDFTEHYDQEDDIYYVGFKTGEPSHVVEVDDVLLVEVGMFSGMPTGFRILNFKKNKVPKVSFLLEAVEKVFHSAKDKFTSDSRIRENQIEKTLEKVLA